MAEAKMHQVADEIRSRWPSVEGIAIVQRVGRLFPQTPTVLIVCTAAHRDTGVFEAARYGIDRLKEIVPVWKKEVSPDGEFWWKANIFPSPGNKKPFCLQAETGMSFPGVFCSNCGGAYPKDGVPYRCSNCGGLYDFRDGYQFDPTQVERSQPGIWRFRHTFGLPPYLAPVTLGEGDTPLLWVEALGRRVALKCEFLNPSALLKTAVRQVSTTWLKSRGVTEAVEDSSGNAGASLAAYAARAGNQGANIYT